MTARDDLAALIEPLLPGAGGAFEYGWDSPTAWAGEIADSVIGAGWRPPTAPLHDPRRDDGCPQCVAIRSSATA